MNLEDFCRNEVGNCWSLTTNCYLCLYNGFRGERKFHFWGGYFKGTRISRISRILAGCIFLLIAFEFHESLRVRGNTNLMNFTNPCGMSLRTKITSDYGNLV